MRFIPIRDDVIYPVKKTLRSICYDICLNTSKPLDEYKDIAIDLKPYSGKEKYLILPTGLKMEVSNDENVHVKIYARSSTYMKYGFILANGTGIIDSDYTHEIGVLALFYEHDFVRIDDRGVYTILFGKKEYIIRHGSRIAQIEICQNIEYASVGGVVIENVYREGGFGSTGHQ